MKTVEYLEHKLEDEELKDKKLFVKKKKYNLLKSLHNNKNPFLWAEVAETVRVDDSFLDFYTKKPEYSALLYNFYKNSSLPDDSGEFDNMDLILKAWEPGGRAMGKTKGIGKTTIGLSLKVMYDKNFGDGAFNLDEIFWTIPDKMKYIRKLTNDDVNKMFQLDESWELVGQSSRVDMKRMERLDEATRIYGYNNLYCQPKRRRGRETLKFNYDYQLQVCAKDVENNVVICALFNHDATRALGHVVFDRPPKNLWKQYQEKKNEANDRVRNQSIADYDIDEIYDHLLENKDLLNLYAEHMVYRDAVERKKLGMDVQVPMKPRIAITDRRMRAWLQEYNRELTNNEMEVFVQLIDDRLINAVSQDGKILIKKQKEVTEA